MDFSSLDLDLDLDFGFNKKDPEKEFIQTAKLNFQPVDFKNAQDMVNGIDWTQDHFCMVSGKFIFGDLIEAFVLQNRCKTSAIYLTTLGMGQNNVDSIVNLVKYLHCDQVNLIVSNYFVAKERAGLVPYMIDAFKDLPVKVAVLASHAKICLIQSKKFGNFSIFGSANLSSSNNLEQFCICHDQNIFNYIKAMLDGVMADFTVIDGIANETLFKNNQGNTGQKAYQKVKEYTESFMDDMQIDLDLDLYQEEGD